MEVKVFEGKLGREHYIFNFILEHNNWHELLTDKHITLKESGKRVIFNYAIFADFTDPVVQEARGIIIDTETLDVVCWPFR